MNEMNPTMTNMVQSLYEKLHNSGRLYYSDVCKEVYKRYTPSEHGRDRIIMCTSDFYPDGIYERELIYREIKEIMDKESNKIIQEIFDDIRPFNFKEETMKYKLEYAPVGSKVPMTQLPVPYRMWVTEHGYTTVEWTDGTKTTAHAEDEEHATVYGGFMACVTKKLYGSTTHAIQRMITALETAAEPAKRKAEQKARRKAYIQERIKYEKEMREERIRSRMEEMRIDVEAEARLHREEEL